MKAVMSVGVVVVLAAGVVRAQEEMPRPTKEHKVLERFAGEWETAGEMVMAPGQPPVTSKGTESTRLLGGFWSVSEMQGECMGVPVRGLMTVGYDAAKKKYVGTWVCSMDGYLWKYEGTADATGTVLTLETEGPNMTAPGKTAKMRDVIALKSPDHKVLTSSILGDDGKWVTFMTMTARRKK